MAKKNMTKLQKRVARNKIKQMFTFLTTDERKRLRKDRQRTPVSGKPGQFQPRPGVKEWILSQANIKNFNKMKKLKLFERGTQ